MVRRATCRVLAVLAALATSSCVRIPLRDSVEGTPREPSLLAAFSHMRAEEGHSAGLATLSDPAAAWAARWEVMASARDHVDVTYFIVDDDVFGMSFLGHLYQKAKAGVGVRMVIDARGTSTFSSLVGRDVVQELVATGKVDARIYNPPLRRLWDAITAASFIPVSAGTHNKILAADNQIAVTGGRNIGAVYFTDRSEGPTAVADTDVLIDGEATVSLAHIVDAEFFAPTAVAIAPDLINIVPQRDVLNMSYALMDAWLNARVPKEPRDDAVAALEHAAVAFLDNVPDPSARERIDELAAQLAGIPSLYGVLPMKPVPRFETGVRVVTTPSRASKAGDDAIATDAFVRALGGARSSVLIQSPYFVLTPRILRALTAASRRGVQITVLTNSAISSDNPASQALFVDSFPEIMARVPTLRIFVSSDTQLLHAKRAVFDDVLTLVGSYNIDPFSANMNAETVIAAWSPALAVQHTAEIRARLGHDVIEYKIARDKRGHARRYPRDDPDPQRAGKVIVEYGPHDHVPADRLTDLRTLKQVLIGVRDLWDFDVVVW